MKRIVSLLLGFALMVPLLAAVGCVQSLWTTIPTIL